MKRRLALSLAALLLLGCLTPALAAEGDAELSLYQQYGPWGEWPQEQKDAAEETWTDGQWDDYWTESVSYTHLDVYKRQVPWKVMPARCSAGISLLST